MPTLVILEAKAKSGTLGQIKEFLGKRLPETRAYEGCQSLTPYLNEDGRSLVIVEALGVQAALREVPGVERGDRSARELRRAARGPPRHPLLRADRRVEPRSPTLPAIGNLMGCGVTA